MITRTLVSSPVLLNSSLGFLNSSPGFADGDSEFFTSTGPGFSRVQVFFESEQNFNIENLVLKFYAEFTGLMKNDKFGVNKKNASFNFATQRWGILRPGAGCIKK